MTFDFLNNFITLKEEIESSHQIVILRIKI